MKRLVQLHHQNRKDRSDTIMVAQREIKNPEEMREFVEDVKISHPLPEDCDWLVVEESSPLFVLAVQE